MNSKDLYDFVKRAGKNTYAAGGKVEEKPERAGFIELTYSEGDITYRDSYTGHFRSRGSELVREKGTPIWSSLYGGGMVEGQESLADVAFEFLMKAMLADEPGFETLRGPHTFEDGDWKYTYDQEGGVDEFAGYEEISYKGEVVFFHRIIGGVIKS